MKALFSKEQKIKWYEFITMVIGFGFLVWFCIPFFFGVFNIGSYFGIFVSFAAMGYFPLNRLCKIKLKQKAYYILFSVVNFIAAVFAIWVTFLTGLMVFAVKQVPLAHVTAVVLGNQVIGDEPSASLKSRLDRAVKFLQDNPSVNCVVAGGMGTDEDSPEAEVMFHYLVKAGIDANRIAMDNQSHNTRENLANAKQIIADKGWNKNIAIITEYYHEFRAGRLADELEMRFYAVPADTPWYIFSCSYGREILSLTKFFCHL